jgi:hypothetical protein
MTRPVDPIGPLSPTDRRKVERRDGERRAPGSSRLPTVTPATLEIDDVAETRGEASRGHSAGAGVEAAAAFAAQQMGQAGKTRGLRGGPPGRDAARSAYLGAEYSGSNERRPQPGRLDDTEA